MKPITLATAADWSGGVLAQGAPDTVIDSVSTDTRDTPRGALFVALQGDRFDAHSFLPQAVAAGAGALMVSIRDGWPENVGIIRTENTLASLQRLARNHRRDWGGIVVGLTGSNGKTSTKDLTRAVLSQRWKVNATKGNLNNHIGLPLTLLATQPEDRIAVCEMGMNHPGEIAPLAAIAAPDVGIITNVGTAHIEFMGSRAAIAVEKGMLAEAVKEDGCVILNANDDFTPSIARRSAAKVLTAGNGAGDVRVTDLETGADGSHFTLHLPDGSSAPVHLPVPGRHMAGNAALAAAAGFHLGMRIEEIVAGLESASLTKGRLQMRRAAGLTFLDDSYNANLDSMCAALETLAGFACTGRRVAVLGRMAELGSHAEQDHRAVGEAVQRAGMDELCVVGTTDAPLIAEGFLAAGGRASALHSFPDQAAAAAHLRATAHPADLILIKGSRSAAMEQVIELLTP
jgi:UDP-N-acetylmuramoyl-tripeptide--D-alanyl-D-alanine ligase